MYTIRYYSEESSSSSSEAKVVEFDAKTMGLFACCFACQLGCKDASTVGETNRGRFGAGTVATVVDVDFLVVDFRTRFPSSPDVQLNSDPEDSSC